MKGKMLIGFGKIFGILSGFEYLWSLEITLPQRSTLECVPGIKINELNMLDSRGYSRSRISSRAIEAYLIQVMRSLRGLGALQPTGDMPLVRRSVQFFLDNLLSQTPDQQQTLAAIGEDLFAIAQDQPFLFPSAFTFVVRAFSTLEGIGYILDPDFSFVKIAAPYAQELLESKQKQRTGTQLVQKIRKQADDARTYTMSMPYRVQRREEFVNQLVAGDLNFKCEYLRYSASLIQKLGFWPCCSPNFYWIGGLPP